MNAQGLFISPEDEFKINQIFDELREKYKDYQDPWGFNIELCEKTLRRLMPFYRTYFKVRVFGAENVKDHAYMVVSNHTGQLPIDGMLITIALAFEVTPPRILRVMVERFLAQLPFLGDLSAQTGAILGDRTNCQFLLDHGESILVFPEGVRGIAKNTPDFYKLRPFSQGFYRIALQKKTPILPVCVIGAEEMFPFVFHAKKIAQFFKLPALPITANFFPLPSPVDIYIGKEIPVPDHLEVEASDKEIKENVYHIENIIKRMVIHGLKNRRPFFDVIRKPISKYVIREFRTKGFK
ncbi:MAG TPA: lysophospholipid acyltransferase family protein [Bacteriovoracaceae bacterium]|nr:lysophospholipid acyltransferase family protein [Bacteriovoracaceae bacterium]